MKKILFVFTFLFSSFFSSLIWSAENFDDCVLENLKDTAGDVAARAIIHICELKFKVEFGSSTICAETEAKITNNIIFLTNITEPFSGYNYCKHPNGITKSKGDIKNGKKNDKWMWWHKDGNVGLEINYIEGKKNGKLIKWYKYTVNFNETISLNGQMQSEENYKDDKKEGKSTLWYPSGAIQLEENYKDDKKNGQSRSWYMSGQIELEENYKDDKKEGKSIEWYPSGKILKEKIYKNDLCISGDC